MQKSGKISIYVLLVVVMMFHGGVVTSLQGGMMEGKGKGGLFMYTKRRRD